MGVRRVSVQTFKLKSFEGKGRVLCRGTVGSKRWLLRLSAGPQFRRKCVTKPIGEDQGKIGQNCMRITRRTKMCVRKIICTIALGEHSLCRLETHKLSDLPPRLICDVKTFFGFVFCLWLIPFPPSSFFLPHTLSSPPQQSDDI